MLKPIKVVAATSAVLISVASQGGIANAATSPHELHTNHWVMKQSAHAGRMSPNIALGICKGSFNGPEKLNGQAYMNVFIQCSGPATIIASAALDKCVRVGGPDDFSCTTVARGHGSTARGYYLTVPASTTCKTGQYRPRAYYMSVDGVDYPDVTGNVVTVTC